MKPSKAFTLIELLIVVAIIGILAAIAIPNFLEAQVRAKISAARSDLRTIAGALEQYAVDATDYPPNDGAFGEIPVQLTTPIAYLSRVNFVDPFARDTARVITPLYAKSPLYSYARIMTRAEADQWRPRRRIPREAIDGPDDNQGALERYGKYRLVSVGPDRVYLDVALQPGFHSADILYDPTNGSVSFGNIIRTQKATSGEGAFRRD